MADLTKRDEIFKLINTYNDNMQKSFELLYGNRNFTGKGKSILEYETTILDKKNEGIQEEFTRLVAEEYAKNGNSALIIEIKDALMNKKQTELLYGLVKVKLEHNDLQDMEDMLTSLITNDNLSCMHIANYYPSVIPIFKNILENTMDIKTLMGLAFVDIRDKEFNSMRLLDIDKIAEKVIALNDLEALNRFGEIFASDVSPQMREKLKVQFDQLSMQGSRSSELTDEGRDTM